jgi:hypothetical protein
MNTEPVRQECSTRLRVSGMAKTKCSGRGCRAENDYGETYAGNPCPSGR